MKLHATVARALFALTLFVFAGSLTACMIGSDLAASAQDVAGGNAVQGQRAIERYGCGSCHTIAGIVGADGLVGPPLTGVGARAYIAGVLSNNPDNMVRWIQNPQQYVPGNAMPNLNISEADARDMAAYLATLTHQPR